MTTALAIPQYPFDPTGVNPANRITGELQPLTGVGDRDFYYIVPLSGPFFATSMQLSFKSVQGELRQLFEGIDYALTHHFVGASRACGKPIYGSITFLNKELRGTLILNSYQNIGGEWLIDSHTIARILAESLANPRTITWDQVAGYPNIFPPITHAWNLQDMVGQSAMVDAMNRVCDAILTQATNAITEHIHAIGNVHGVTCNDIGAVSTIQLIQAVQQAIEQLDITTTNVSEGQNKYFTEARALASKLDGYTVTSNKSALGETDTMLFALQKIQAQLLDLNTKLATKAPSLRPAFTGLSSQNLITIQMPASITMDISEAEAFDIIVKGSGAVVFDTRNVGDMTGKVVEFAVTTINDTSGNAYAIAWPANVKWVDGAPPPRTTTAGAKDLWYFTSEDNMVSWTGSLSNQNPR